MISHRYAGAHTERRRARSWSDLDIGPNHDNREPSIMAKLSLLQLIRQANKNKHLRRICSDNLRPNRSHNYRWIMQAPTSSGRRGMGDSVGAALSYIESGSDFTAPPAF